MQLIFNDKLEEVDTFESYFYPPFSGSGNIVIHHINVDITHHLLNPTSDLLFYDRSFIVFLGARIIPFKGVEEMHIPLGDSNILSVGGVNMATDQYDEMTVSFQDGFFQILPETRSSHLFWRPFGRTGTILEVETVNVPNEFKFEDLPLNLQQLLGPSIVRLEPFQYR